MPTIAELLQTAAARLEGVTDTPRLDAEILLSQALGTDRAQLLARLRESAPPSELETLLKQREAGAPLAYILGEWEFYGLTFTIRPPALVPRPETEHLVETVLDGLGDRRSCVLELCTGTGCVAVAIAMHAPNATILATDINPGYVSLARENVERHGVAGRVQVVEGDLFEAVPDDAAPFHAICANPPYVAASEYESLSRTIRDYEDTAALVAGPDGLDVIRRIVAVAPVRLQSEGLLALEIGHQQADAAKRLFTDAGFGDVQSTRDLSGIERIVSGRLGHVAN